MKRMWLVQRLKKPFPKSWEHKRNPFSFGAGLRNGGLSEKAAKMLDDVFQFSFMGRGEFEFGAVPKALAAIFEARKDYIAFDVRVLWKHEDWSKKRKRILKGKSPVYVICHRDWKEDVIKFIRSKALYPLGKKYETLESVLLDAGLAKVGKCQTCGWLEISNGYFFFTDLQMYKKTCGLFEIKK